MTIWMEGMDRAAIVQPVLDLAHATGMESSPYVRSKLTRCAAAIKLRPSYAQCTSYAQCQV